MADLGFQMDSRLTLKGKKTLEPEKTDDNLQAGLSNRGRIKPEMLKLRKTSLIPNTLV